MRGNQWWEQRYPRTPTAASSGRAGRSPPRSVPAARRAAGPCRTPAAPRAGPPASRPAAPPSPAVDAGVAHHHAVAPGTLVGDQPAAHLQLHQRRVAFQRVAPPAAAPGDEVQHVAGEHLHVVALRRQHLPPTGRPLDPLRAPRARRAAVDAPGVGQPPVVVDRDLAGLLEHVRHVDAVAAAVQPRAAGVGHGLPLLDAQRVVRLQVLAGDVDEARPQRVPVRPVAERPPGYAAEADRVELEPLARAVARRVVARVHEVRRRREARRVEQRRVGLPQQAAEQVEHPPDAVVAPRQRRRVARLPVRARPGSSRRPAGRSRRSRGSAGRPR